MGNGGSQPAARWLLIGNSRWHWAEPGPDGLRIHHQEASIAAVAPPLPLRAWAAVGSLPAFWWADPLRQLTVKAVPLRGAPPWLGVDRALAGWMGWRLTGGPVLVADAGTVLSLTRVDASGRFCGGRLMAGLGLQLRAMASGTAALPTLPSAQGFEAPPLQDLGLDDPWPHQTQQAMFSGVIRSLVAGLLSAQQEAAAAEPGCRLLLCGGDGAVLLPFLQQALMAAGAERPLWEPDLALRALVALRPA